MRLLYHVPGLGAGAPNRTTALAWILWPWLAAGGSAVARVAAVHGGDVPTWRRLVVEVSSRDPSPDGGEARPF